MSYSASLADCRESMAKGVLPNLAPATVQEYRVILAQAYGDSVFQWEGKAISWVHAVWECIERANLAGIDPTGFHVFALRSPGVYSSGGGSTMTGIIGGRWVSATCTSNPESR